MNRADTVAPDDLARDLLSGAPTGGATVREGELLKLVRFSSEVLDDLEPLLKHRCSGLPCSREPHRGTWPRCIVEDLQDVVTDLLSIVRGPAAVPLDVRDVCRKLQDGAKAVRQALENLEQLGAGGLLDSGIVRLGADPDATMRHLAEAASIIERVLRSHRFPPKKRGRRPTGIEPWLISRTGEVLARHQRPVTQDEAGIWCKVVRILWPLVVDRVYPSGLGSPEELKYWFKPAKTLGE